MIVVLEASIGRKAVAEHGGAGIDFAFDEATDAGCGEIVDRLQADAARIAVWRELDGANDMDLADGAAAWPLAIGSLFVR